jgi:hypothetical protein
MSTAPNSTATLHCDSPEVVAFINLVQERSNAHFDKDFPSLTKEKFVCDRGSKFLAIDHYMCNGQRSVYCFIAACDSESKTLGKVKKGDILKAATYKAPARHVRGTIYNTDPLKGTGLYGVDYLK